MNWIRTAHVSFEYIETTISCWEAHVLAIIHLSPSHTTPQDEIVQMEPTTTNVIVPLQDSWKLNAKK